MFEPKNILFIPNFEFDNKATSDKILLILAHKDNANTSVIYTLTTSQTKKLPDKYLRQGCCNEKLEKLSMFVFEKGREVGKTIHGHPVSFHEITAIQAHSNIMAIY